MPPASTPTPTKAELAILRTLWDQGASTVREVHDALAAHRTVAYTTTLKTLQVMTAKGLVVREERGTQHLYRARHPERQMQRRLVRELLDRAFGGSTAQLVIQALASKRASPDELAEIRRLIAAQQTEEKDHD
jgi:predicted transcriptional regulator